MAESTQTIPVISYAAKSTPDEAGSLESQHAAIQLAVELEGGREIVAAYEDEGASGYRSKREDKLRGQGMADAREHAENLAASGHPVELWVYQSDRLARGDSAEATHLVQHVIWAMESKVRIRSVTDDFTFAGEGFAFAGMMGDRAQHDSRAKSAHVRRGKEKQFADGRPMGGPIPDGYRVVVERDANDKVLSRTYLPDPERAPIIEEIFAWSEQGVGDPTIARRLNERGVLTKPTKKHPLGAKWSRRRVQDTLTNMLYCGRIVRHRGTVDEEWTEAKTVTPIISPERYDAIAKKRASRNVARSGRNGPPRPVTTTTRFALAGIAVCAKCGERMYCQTSAYKRVDGSKARRYLCGNVHAGGGVCDAPSVDAEITDAAIVPHLEKWLADFASWSESIRDSVSADLTQYRAAAQRIRAELHKVERAEARAQDEYAEALSSEAETKAIRAALGKFVTKRERLEAKLEATEMTVRSMESKGGPTDAMLSYWFDLAANIRGRIAGATSLADVNAELRIALDKVELEQRGGIDKEALAEAHEDGWGEQYKMLELQAEVIIIRPHSKLGAALEPIEQFVRLPLYDNSGDESTFVGWSKPPILIPSGPRPDGTEGGFAIANPADWPGSKKAVTVQKIGDSFDLSKTGGGAPGAAPNPKHMSYLMDLGSDSWEYLPKYIQVPELAVEVVRTAGKRVVLSRIREGVACGAGVDSSGDLTNQHPVAVASW